MKILICFDLCVPGKGVISGHAIHEVQALTEAEIKCVCREQRDLVQKSLARSAQLKQEDPVVSGELILRSVVKLDEERPLVLPR